MGVSTRELALISAFSALWIAAQDTLGPPIGEITGVHGAVQRFLGWLLMLLLAELTERFGRVTLMSVVAALATRMIRRSASLYPWVLASGYVLGGLVFDLLFFISFPWTKELNGNAKRSYFLLASLISGVFVLRPYLLFQLYTLEGQVFTASLPIYAYDLVKGTILSIFGTFIGSSIAPRIKGALHNLSHEVPRLD